MKNKYNLYVYRQAIWSIFPIATDSFKRYFCLRLTDRISTEEEKNESHERSDHTPWHRRLVRGVLQHPASTYLGDHIQVPWRRHFMSIGQIPPSGRHVCLIVCSTHNCFR